MSWPSEELWFNSEERQAIQAGCGSYPVSCSMDNSSLRGRDLKLNTRPRLVPWLRDISVLQRLSSWGARDSFTLT